MSMLSLHRRRVAVIVVALAIVVALTIGLLQSGSGSGVETPAKVPSVEQARRDVAEAPPALARLYAHGNQLLQQDGDEFVAYVKRLRGYPVVINKWAAWCEPCRAEFPILRQAAAKYGTRVAFLGLNAGDKQAAATAFLRRQPTVYPHVRDPNEQIARAMQAGASFPSTIFLDRKGDIVNVFVGAYPSRARLEQDLRRYAGVDARPAPAEGAPSDVAPTTEPRSAR
jgi:cytochrome c biogenesis protein CcmG/thiol:disulfide interchange protein DsbE